MSKENRERMYKTLVAEGRLSQDDGALEKEFGKLEVIITPKPVSVPKKDLKPKRSRK